MKYNSYINFAFLLIILIFPFIQNILIVRPTLSKLDLKSEFKKKYILKKINYNNQLNNYQKKKISIGDTYIINYSLNKKVKITPISAWSLKNVDFRRLSNKLPNLIIDSREIKEINENNYALGSINDNNFAQTCLLNSKGYFFSQQKLYIPKYSELNYWKEILLKSLKNNILFLNSKGENCFLITSSEIDDFEATIESIYKLINIK